MFKNKFFLFLYAATTRVFVDLVGRLMLSEIIALVLFPFTNFRKLFSENKELKLVLRGLLVLFAAQIVSDVYNVSSPSDFLRSWAMIIFASLSTVFFVNHLSKNITNIIYYLLAIMLVNLFFGQGELDTGIIEENSNYFKVRFIGFLNPLIILVGYWLFKLRWKNSAVFLFLLFGLICMILDARSNGLVFIVSAMLLFIKLKNIQMTRTKVILLGIIFSGILYGSYVLYVNQVLYNGLGGNNAQYQLRETSNPYNPFELLYYGRGETLVAFHAITEKPIMGHGSWAKDKNNKYAKLLARLTNKNYTYYKPGFIPSHSILLSAWLYSGIIGFISLAYILFLLVKLFFKYYKYSKNSSVLPVIIVISIEMIWHIMFSPYGHLRTTFPVFAALIIVNNSLLIKQQTI